MAMTAVAAHDRAEATYRPAANKLGLWIFLGSEACLFAALISTRFALARLSTPESLNQELALALAAILLGSSACAYLAENAIAHDDRKNFLLFTTGTIVLGLAFLVGVVFEWREALDHFGPGTAYGSVFFMLIGTHAFHVLTGILALAVVLNLGRKGHFGSADYWGVEGVVKYWHFVDVAWVVIYPTLYLVS